MEIKRLISRFVYRIEAQPGGGFIARANDPAVPPIEAATREELQQKIQATIAANLQRDFPGLKVAADKSGFKLDFHVEHKAEGGFAIHSDDPKAEPIEIATHDDIESHLAEKFIQFVGKRLSPELAQVLETPGASGDVKVSVDKAANTITVGSRTIHMDRSQDAAEARMVASDSAATGSMISNAPITPESGGNALFFRMLIALAVIGALVYVFFRLR